MIVSSVPRNACGSTQADRVKLCAAVNWRSLLFATVMFEVAWPVPCRFTALLMKPAVMVASPLMVPVWALTVESLTVLPPVSSMLQ